MTDGSYWEQWQGGWGWVARPCSSCRRQARARKAAACYPSCRLTNEKDGQAPLPDLVPNLVDEVALHLGRHSWVHLQGSIAVET